MKEKGSASVVILGVLLLLTVLFLSASFILSLSMRNLQRSSESDREKQMLLDEADRAVELLLEDPTPFADSPMDPVWEQLKNPLNREISVTLKDVSSFLGANWARKELLEKMDVLKIGKTALEFQQFREDTGIHLKLSTFLDFIEEDYIEEYFTTYSYFNINISDEFVLRKLYFIRSSDLEEAEIFHTRVQNVRINKEHIENKDLKEFLGETDYDLLFPIVNAEPVMNIHFIPEAVLKRLYAYYKIPEERADKIMVLRESSELPLEELSELIGKEYKESLLYHYLGVRTWFWEIKVTGNRMELNRIIARMPPEGEEVRAEFRLIEEGIRP